MKFKRERFFILGNPRSGTTLLRLMLNKHKSICVPPEAGFLIWLYDKGRERDWDYTDFIEELKKTKKIENWNLDFDLLEEHLYQKKPQTYADLNDCIYYFYASRVLKKEVDFIGDKNNYFISHIETLNKIYPQSKYIHIVRDGRSVAASYQELMKKNIHTDNAPDLPININEIATSWINNIKMIQKSLNKINATRVLEVRFEDIVQQPIKTLHKIMSFLNLSYDENMLSYYTTTEQEGLEPVEYMEWKSKNLKPLMPEEATRYMSLDKENIKAFEEIAFELLKEYKYI